MLRTWTICSVMGARWGLSGCKVFATESEVCRVCCARTGLLFLGGSFLVSAEQVFISAAPRYECPVPQLLPDLERVKEEIQMLHFDRGVWRTFDAAAAGSVVVRDSFARAWFADSFYRCAALAVRAMVDRNPDSCTLVNLMAAVAESADAVSCPFVPEMWAVGGATLDPEKVRGDVAALQAAAAQVRQYVNKFLAHVDRNRKGGPPDAAVVDAAVDLLGDLLKKYVLILTGADLVVTPLPHFHVAETFREAWIPAPAPSAAS